MINRWVPTVFFLLSGCYKYPLIIRIIWLLHLCLWGFSFWSCFSGTQCLAYTNLLYCWTKKSADMLMTDAASLIRIKMGHFASRKMEEMSAVWADWAKHHSKLSNNWDLSAVCTDYLFNILIISIHPWYDLVVTLSHWIYPDPFWFFFVWFFFKLWLFTSTQHTAGISWSQQCRQSRVGVAPYIKITETTQHGASVKV